MSSALPVALLPVRAALDLRVLRAVPFATVCVVLSATGHVLASGCPVPVSALLLGWLAVCAGAVVLAGRERSLREISGGLAVGEVALHLLFHSAQDLLFHSAQAGASGSAGIPGGRGMPGMAMAGRTAPGAGVPGQFGMRLMSTTAGPAMATPSGAGRTVLRTATGPHMVVAAAPHAVVGWHTAFMGVSPAMLATHLVAALAAAWWLRRGEAALWRLVRLTAKAAQTTARACTTALGVALTLAAALVGALSGLGHRPVRTTADGGQRRLPAAAFMRHCVIRRGPPREAVAVRLLLWHASASRCTGESGRGCGACACRVRPRLPFPLPLGYARPLASA
ncbi:hypothetical protein [Kitasatospora sp. GP82]|uniref:hypothetical protein n=1 Tax=Kitasatospora sp. GP82 TaxID=3035089 RepID=UPI0024771A58|nr:hypothetical protein [Kitasatospora sp. GP82]MDH6126388.1 hypothetical protein [Kitasatospora sp. GP82]